MGDIIGGAIGGIGSLLGGKKGQSDALKGFSYLTGKNGVGPYVKNGRTANQDALDALTNPNSTAFKNYLSSTGYNFQKQQGMSAITGSAAARGLLNSGGTAKALAAFGTNLANTNFNNYLSNLGDISKEGLTAAGEIGQAGTAGGAAAGAAAQSGTSSGFGQLGSAAGGAYNYFNSNAGNIFSNPAVYNTIL
jgi:hypothetical protein